jgi:hypothetical protein
VLYDGGGETRRSAFAVDVATVTNGCTISCVVNRATAMRADCVVRIVPGLVDNSSTRCFSYTSSSALRVVDDSTTEYVSFISFTIFGLVNRPATITTMFPFRCGG